MPLADARGSVTRPSGSGAIQRCCGLQTPIWLPTCSLPVWRSNDMLGWALAFLLIAILAAVFGFTGIAAASASVAKFIFFIFLVIFLVTLIMSVSRRV